MLKLQPIYAVFLTLFLLYAFSGNPPIQTTGAPGEDNCTNCHATGNASFDGTVELQGLPDVIIPGSTYNVSVVTKITSGTPSRAGFQMVVLDGAGNNAGNLMNAGTNADVSVVSGKNYIGHNPAKPFSGIDSVAWTVDWTAPATIGSDSVKVYINSILGNGSGNAGDLMVSSKTAYQFQTTTVEPVEIAVVETSDLSCFGANDGSAMVSASGGTGSYTYQWSNDSITAAISNLSIGSYIVTATDSENNTATATITINQPDEVSVSIADIVNIDCDNPVGSATAMTTGGVAPFAYQWSTTDTTVTVSLSEGMHGVTVSDANQCTGTTTFTIAEDIRLPVAFAGFDVAVTCSDTNTTTAQLEAFNTTTGQGVSYLWTTPDGNIVLGDTTLMPIVDAAGTYILTVLTAENGCTASDTALVTFDTTIPTANAGNDQELDCTNSTVVLNGSGGVGTILWTTDNGNITAGENTLTPTVDAAGTYTLTIGDAATGCLATDMVEVTQDAAVPQVTVGGDMQIGCNDSDTLQIAGNATMGGAIIYAWSSEDGAIIGDATALQTMIVGTGTYVLTATDTSNSCTAQASFVVSRVIPPTADAGMGGELNCATESLTLDASNSIGDNLIYEWITENGNIVEGNTTTTPIVNAAGIYILTVADTISGCISNTSVEVTEVTMDDLFAASGDAEQLTCANSSITFNAAASQGDNIVYEWTTADGNIVEGGTTLMPTIDAPGRYVLTVMDTITTCSAVSSINISQDITLPEVSAGEAQMIDCTNTSATLNGSSNLPFNATYTWTTDIGNILGGGNTKNPVVNAAGIYTLTVVDTFTNCSASATVEITSDAALPMANAGMTMQLDCNNDTLTLAGSGSTGDNLTTFWTTADGNLLGGMTTFSPMVDEAGVYTLTITDTVSGCSSTSNVTVVSNTESPMVEAGDAAQTFCDNSSLSINATASEGDNFTYFWCTTEGSIVSGGDALNVVIDGAGLFEFIVTNTATGCKNVDTVMVTAFDSPEITVDTTNDTLVLVVTGGMEPYTYEWTGESISLDSSLTDLAPGDYGVTVTDDNGCADETSFTIDMVSDVSEIENSIEKLQVFPNPTNTYFALNIDFNEPQIGTVFIMNKVGQQVWQQAFNDKNINVEVDVMDWSAGIYYMLIETEKGVKTEEIVVIK